MFFAASLLFSSFCVSASAQQFAGDTISGTLPSQDGSEVAYFRISDPSGANDQLTLVNYYSLDSNGERLQESAIQRAVIMMFGMGRNAADYEGFVSTALGCSGIAACANAASRRSLTLCERYLPDQALTILPS